MPAVAVWTPEDHLLGAVAPLALAAAAGTALVVDLDRRGPRYPGHGSLASLVGDGPRGSDLSPARPGLAVLRNGGIDPDAAADVLASLVRGWPAVVLRLPPQHPDACPLPVPAVPVRPLLPAGVLPWNEQPAVYQGLGWRASPPGPGPVLPRPRPASWSALLQGRLPPRDRWLRSWSRVWEYPWG